MRDMVRLTASIVSLLAVSVSVDAQEAVPVVAIEPNFVERASPLRFSGTITSERFSTLSSYVAGLVVRADADEGFIAKRGEVLVVLDSTLANLELLEAHARLDEARARLSDAQRLRGEAEKLGQNISQSTLKSRMAQEHIQGSVVARLKAELEFQEEIVDRHVIRAPFDGVVVDKLTEVGEWANLSSPVIEFLATDGLRLDIQVPQDYYPLVRQEVSALVRIDAFPNDVFTGHVKAIVPASDPDVRTFLVRLVIDNPSNAIIVGMSGEAQFGISDGESAVEIPRDVLVRYPDGSASVWVIEETSEGTFAHERQVVLGDSFGDMAKVMNGLHDVALIVVRGNETLDDGTKVRLVERLPDRNGGPEETD